MNILIVLTSHDQLGNTGRPTGFWLEEFAAPYYVFKDAGAEITLAAMIDVLGHVTLSRCEQLNIQRRDHDRNQAGEPTRLERDADELPRNVAAVPSHPSARVLGNSPSPARCQ